TIIGMYTVDKLGRRALLIFGSLGLASIYTLLGACYYYQFSGIAVLVLVMLAIGCYAMTLAPITWVVISEIFPTKIRGAAMAISTFSLWTACFILTYTFPLLNASLGAYGTFWLYGVICVLGFWFIKKNLTETEDNSLEQIEQEQTQSYLVFHTYKIHGNYYSTPDSFYRERIKCSQSMGRRCSAPHVPNRRRRKAPHVFGKTRVSRKLRRRISIRCRGKSFRRKKG